MSALPDTLPALPPHVHAALAEAKARLVELYGDRLDRVVLYGSYARGDARPDSDVDLLVVLRGAYEPNAEIKQIGAIRLDLSMRHEVDVSMQPYSVAEVADLDNPFMHHVTGDGVPL